MNYRSLRHLDNSTQYGCSELRGGVLIVEHKLVVVNCSTMNGVLNRRKMEATIVVYCLK